MSTAGKPVIGISSCLLGQPVRFDGAHKRDSWLVDQLGRFVEYQPFCPEVGIGLGVPRPTLRLVGTRDDQRVVAVNDPGRNVTAALQDFAFQSLPQISRFDGYVLKSRSPSCGMERVKLYNAKGHPENKGVGAFAGVVLQALPNLPVEEEGRLNDAVLRENFVNRIYVYHRWHRLRAQGLTPERLIRFHTQHKYMVMAHSQAAYQRLGRLLAHLKGVDLNRAADAYESELMTALKRRVSRKRHVNVLQHIQGYLKKHINIADKAELADSIEAYRRAEVPLVVPVKLLAHYFRNHPDPYIGDQWYFNPYPAALGLRNQI